MLRLLAITLVLVFCGHSARAAASLRHPPLPTVAIARVSGDGTLDLTIIHDALAFALNDTSSRVGDGAMYELLDAPSTTIEAALADGRARMSAGLRLRTGTGAVPFEITSSPTLESIRQWLAEHPDRKLPCKLEYVVRAQLPASTKLFTLRFPEILADVLLVVEYDGQDPAPFPLAPAEVSPEIELRLSPPVPQAKPQPASTQTTPPAATGTFGRFISLGFRHIIPQGADHACFVLGLFLLCPRFKPVLWQISAFTLAHTITLTLTSLNVIGMPSSIVEPAIALSIAFVAIENLFTAKLHPWRPAIACLFGLVHGMGVASAFNEAPFPAGQLVPSLAAFTIGVEAGHIAVLLAAFATLGWFRNRPWYRRRVALPLSGLIALIAIIWTFQRVF